MAVVQEIKQGKCTVRIHDDAYINRSKEEVEETILKASEIVHRNARNKINSEDKTA